MAAEITPFTFPVTGQPVRTILRDGDPWFVGKDAATILEHTNTRKAIRDHVPAAHRGGNESFPLSELGLDPQTVMISEAGLYRLIMRSNTPLAERFQEWVTAEVLPAIRRTGSYSAASVTHALPQDYEEALEALLDKVRDNKALTVENAKLKVKADQFDDWLNGKGCYLIGTVAKMLGLGPKTVWDFLYAEKILINRPDTKRHREPYSRPDTDGWFEIKPVPPERANGHATRTTYLTPYGAEQVRLRLIKRGLLPPQQLALIGGA